MAASRSPSCSSTPARPAWADASSGSIPIAARNAAAASSSRPSWWSTLPRLTRAPANFGASRTAVSQCPHASPSASLEEELAEVALDLGGRRREPRGGAEVFQGGVALAHELQRVAQVVVRRGEVGPEPDGRAEVPQGGGDVAPVDQHRPQVTEDLGVLGLEPQRGHGALDGAVELTEHPVRLGEAQVVRRLAGLEGDRPADERDGPPGVAALECHDTEQVQGVGPVGVLGQGRLVDGRAAASSRPCR